MTKHAKQTRPSDRSSDILGEYTKNNGRVLLCIVSSHWQFSWNYSNSYFHLLVVRH